MGKMLLCKLHTAYCLQQPTCKVQYVPEGTWQTICKQFTGASAYQGGMRAVKCGMILIN